MGFYSVLIVLFYLMFKIFIKHSYWPKTNLIPFTMVEVYCKVEKLFSIVIEKSKANLQILKSIFHENVGLVYAFDWWVMS